MKFPGIAIIVLHYKNLSDTRECLKSLQKIDYPNYCVILVNNDSAEHGEKLQVEFGDFIILVQNKKNLGFAEGNNVGLRSALADKNVDAVFLLNNDTEVEPDILTELSRTPADMVAPRMIRFDYRDKIDNLGIVLMSSGLPFNRTNENQKLFCPSGGAALYSRKLLEAVATPSFTKEGAGGWWFDPLFFAYCEDLDLGWRARLAGFEAAYTTKAIVYHKGSAATSKMSDFAVYHTYRNLLWTQFKNLPAPLLLWQSPWLGLGWFFIFFLYLFKGRSGVILRALWDGMMGLHFVLNHRQQVQRNRKATQKQILSWFTNGLFPRNLLKK